jgi:sec-independent protein translocase protein TatB
MLGLSMTEIVIILGLALLLLGPDQLPSIAKALGKGMREVRKATDDLKSTFEQEMVRIDEPEQRALQPVASEVAARTGSGPEAAAAEDPAAARAAARRAAAGGEAPAPTVPDATGYWETPPEAPAGSPALRLVPPEGVVAREAAKLEATKLAEPSPAGGSDPAPPPPADVKDVK